MTTQPAAPEVAELIKSEQTLQGVAAAALGNLLAGVGVGLVVGTLLHIAGAPGYLRWGGYAALLAWGAIMAVWFAQDEARNWWARRELTLDLAAAEEAIDMADDELAALRYQLETANLETSRLRAEVAALRKSRNFTPATPPASDPVMQDAMQLVSLYHTAEPGKPKVHPARRRMSEYGWSERRYGNALSLLASKGVLRIGEGNVVRWTDNEATQSFERLVSPANGYLEAGVLVSPAPPEGEAS